MRRFWAIVLGLGPIVLGAVVVVFASGAFPDWVETEPYLIVIGALAVVSGIYGMATKGKTGNTTGADQKVGESTGGSFASPLSDVATFTRLPVTSLPGLSEAAASEEDPADGSADAFHSYLVKNGRQVVDYKWSGYTMGTVLAFLLDNGINLMRGEYDDLGTELTEAFGATYVILTPAHRDQFLTQLDSGEFTEGPLRDYYNEFNEDADPNSGKAMLAGIKAIAQSLRLLDEESVILLAVE